jgi:hypothetical protein
MKNRLGVLLFLPALLSLGAFSACDDSYGKVGGADQTVPAEIVEIMEPLRGEWYSHYAKRKLDSYRIGKWKDITDELGAKLDLFPAFDPTSPVLHDGYTILPDDYYIFYDATVYETVAGDGGNGGFEGFGGGFIGIVRAVNEFHYEGSGSGAFIIEYLDGAASTWDPDLAGPPPLVFYGIYYRILTPDRVQMANAVDLAALAAGQKYYLETATLQEAIDKNNAENNGEFIAWGVVIPQDRGK